MLDGVFRKFGYSSPIASTAHPSRSITHIYLCVHSNQHDCTKNSPRDTVVYAMLALWMDFYPSRVFSVVSRLVLLAGMVLVSGMWCDDVIQHQRWWQRNLNSPKLIKITFLIVDDSFLIP